MTEIDALVNAGGFLKACDTVGAETDAGYPEFDFTLDVARRARVILRAAGAKVILTQNGSTAYGPCITQRAAIGNRARADAAISIHADGGPPDGYGFAILVPVLVRNSAANNSMIIEPSRRLADAFLGHFSAATGQVRSTYLGSGGIQPRADLGGLNCSTVPKVFIECANMRNAGGRRHRLRVVPQMLLQAVGLAIITVGISDAVVAGLSGAFLLGAGTSLVYPTLLAAISDGTHPDWRAAALGVYRFWRDSGHAIGALIGGMTAAIASLDAAIAVAAVLTAISGLLAWALMAETHPCPAVLS